MGPVALYMAAVTRIDPMGTTGLDRVRQRPLALIGAAISAGAYGPGQERAPEYLRAHGLVDALMGTSRPVRDAGNVATFVHRPDPEHPQAANVEQVREAVLSVAAAVSDAYTRGEDVLVLGGDCTIELGTVAGALADGSSVGLIYIDLDGDLNTPATGDGVLDWMGWPTSSVSMASNHAWPTRGPGPRFCHHKLCTFSQPISSPSLSGALFSNSTFVTNPSPSSEQTWRQSSTASSRGPRYSSAS
jgi:hypothetical protein